MTDEQLLDLIERREVANQTIARMSHRPLRDLPPKLRAKADEASRIFRYNGAVITNELVRRGKPLATADAVFVATADGLTFVRLDRATGLPPGWSKRGSRSIGTELLHPYKHLIGVQNRPAEVP